ncbi:hypothetical protein [Arthrobacter ramosus]|uniref:Uncharacterized protein n=1 Tax=Arthrobacter ramosus TaxID=1672 RepID=A0ABV5XZR5_ARTRM|nr:hypothetical protein [Arthrobacter ramosus]
MVTSDPGSRLLAGPTAFALMRMRFRSTTVALAFLAIMGVLNVSGIPQLWPMYTAAAAMLVSGFSVAFLILYVAIKAEAEGEAGGPGEDYLQRADFLEIVQSAKAEAEESAQKSRTSRR